MLLADFICFLILASYSQTPSFGPVTGVGGSGCDSRLEYSHSDGEQEDAKRGSKGWNRCVKLLSKNTAVRPASGHVEWGNSPFPRSPKRGRTSSKPKLMNVFSQTLHTAHCSVQSCQNHVVCKFSLLPFALDVPNHSPPGALQKPKPQDPGGPTDDPRQPLVSQWHWCSQTRLQPVHPFITPSLPKPWHLLQMPSTQTAFSLDATSVKEVTSGTCFQ